MTIPTTIRRIQNPDGSVSILRTTTNQIPIANQQQNAKVVRFADGRNYVLFPGQQLVQMPDGKLQIFSQPTVPQQQQQQPQPQLPQHPILSSSANMNSVAPEV